MNIKRMLLLAGMALAAVAFAAPATAGAVVQLKAGGAALLPGDPVTAVSKNLTTTTSSGTLSCQEVVLHYKVNTNGATQVVLDPEPLTGAHNGTIVGNTDTACKLTAGPFTFVAHINTAGTGAVTINTWGTGTAKATFTSLITTPNPLNCEFHGNVSIQARSAPSHIADVETTGPSTLAGTGAGCPTGAEMHGELTLESEGAAVTTDFVSTG